MTQQRDPELDDLIARATAGDAAAQFELGEEYLHGPDDFVDPEEGLRWIVRAAEQAHPHAQLWLSAYHERGEGGAPDPAAAYAWAEKAASHGLPAAQRRLGTFLARGFGCARDLERASRLEVAAATSEARSGDAGAMYQVGEFWRVGRPGHAPDLALAAHWYEAAAGRGDKRAMLRLASLYETGTHVPRSESRALAWYERAGREGQQAAARLRDIVDLRQRAHRGDAAAAWELSMRLGVYSDEGLTWVQAAARLGHAGAGRALFDFYTADSGRSVSPEGRTWIQLAADLGVPEARAFLAPRTEPPAASGGDDLVERMRALADAGDPVARIALESLLRTKGPGRS